MTARELWQCVADDESLEFLGCDEQCVYVRHDGMTTWSLAYESVREHNWERIGPVLRCVEHAQGMRHVTRVVGYYSVLHNWNRSKLAELADRHKGSYDLDARLPSPAMPSGVRFAKAEGPFVLVAARMCLACHELDKLLTENHVPHDTITIDAAAGIWFNQFQERSIADAVLAAFTLQDGTFPVLVDARLRMVNIDTVEREVEQWLEQASSG